MGDVAIAITMVATMTVVDYLNPQTKQPRASVSIGLLDSETVEVRVTYLRDAAPVSWTLIVWLVLALCAVSVMVVTSLVNNGIWLMALIAGVAAYREYQAWLDARSTHRWLASASGLMIERVSPAGLLKRRFIPRNSIRDISHTLPRRANHSGYLSISRDRRLYTTIHFPDLNNGELAAISSALRQGLRL